MNADEPTAEEWTPEFEDVIPERQHDDIILMLPNSVAGEDADLFRATRNPGAWKRAMIEFAIATNMPPRVRLVGHVVAQHVECFGFCPSDTEKLGHDSALPRASSGPVPPRPDRRRPNRPPVPIMSASGKGNGPVFVVQWRKALYDSGLPATVRSVGFVMSDYADTRTGKNAFPSAQRLAHDTGLSQRRVYDYRLALVAAGFAVEVSKGGSVRGGRRSNSRFELTMPTSDSAGTTRDPESPVTNTTPDCESPVPVTVSHMTPDCESPYRSKTGSSPSSDSAPGTRPPVAAGSVASPATADEDEDRPSAGKTKAADRWLTADEIRSARERR